MQREEVKGPPVGFRPAIPVRVKLDSVIRQEGRCKACGEKLGVLEDTQFDHVPALQLRSWDPEEKNTVPPANSADHIEAKHKNCHLKKTTGRKGESRKGDAANGDVPRISKIKRLSKDEAAFRQRLLEKADPLPETAPTKKSKWGKRPFPKGQGFRKSKKD